MTKEKGIIDRLRYFINNRKSTFDYPSKRRNFPVHINNMHAMMDLIMFILDTIDLVKNSCRLMLPETESHAQIYNTQVHEISTKCSTIRLSKQDSMCVFHLQNRIFVCTVLPIRSFSEVQAWEIFYKCGSHKYFSGRVGKVPWKRNPYIIAQSL